MTAKERYDKIKSGLGKQVVIRNGKTTISLLDSNDQIVSLAAKMLASENSKKLTYLAGRGKNTYGIFDLSDYDFSDEIADLESKVSVLEQEFYSIQSITLEEIESLF